MNVNNYYITPEEYALAEQNGVSRPLLNYRVRQALWDKRVAINTPPKTPQIRDFGQWEAVAKKNGINKKQLINRVNKGWDLERAATEPLTDAAERVQRGVMKRRKYSLEMMVEAENNGVSRETFYRRIERGWTPEKAASTPLIDPHAALERGRKSQRKCGRGFYVDGLHIRFGKPSPKRHGGAQE